MWYLFYAGDCMVCEMFNTCDVLVVGSTVVCRQQVVATLTDMKTIMGTQIPN
jgi:hypothetical protein